MACGGCKKGNGNRHTSGNGDLSKFAFLSPTQLRHLKEIKAAEAASKPAEEGEE